MDSSRTNETSPDLYSQSINRKLDDSQRGRIARSYHHHMMRMFFYPPNLIERVEIERIAHEDNRVFDTEVVRRFAEHCNLLGTQILMPYVLSEFRNLDWDDIVKRYSDCTGGA